MKNRFGQVEDDRLREVSQELSPPCFNCGTGMSCETDIYGRRWWVCWNCTKWADEARTGPRE